MPPVARKDPYPSKNFQLILNGVSDDGSSASAGFTEISGLQVEMKPIEYRNGNEDITNRKLPGLKAFSNLVCKRGSTGDVEFWKWVKTALDGNIKRTEGAVILYDEQKKEVMRWTFSRAWPCKYVGPSFKAAGTEVAMETLEICIEELALDA